MDGAPGRKSPRILRARRRKNAREKNREFVILFVYTRAASNGPWIRLRSKVVVCSNICHHWNSTTRSIVYSESKQVILVLPQNSSLNGWSILLSACVLHCIPLIILFDSRHRLVHALYALQMLGEENSSQNQEQRNQLEITTILKGFVGLEQKRLVFSGLSLYLH